MKTKLTFLFFSLLGILQLGAQNNYASWVEILETSGEMSNINDVITDGNFLYLNGVYQGSGTLIGEALPEYVGNNAVIAKTETDGTLVWTATMGSAGIDAFFDIKLDSDGNVIATGYSTQGDSDIEINGTVVVPDDGIINNIGIVAKFSGQDGSLIWEKHWFSGAYVGANPVKLAVDEQGNIFVGGYYSGSFEVDGITITYNQTFGNDIFILKFNDSGVAQWAKTFESEVNNGYATVKSVEAAENAVNVAFEYSEPLIINGNPLPHQGDFYWDGVAKMNKDTGEVENVFAFGSDTGGQSINHMQIDTEGNIFIAGFFSANTGFQIGTTALSGYGQDDGFIAKLDSGLNVLWAKDMGGDYLDRAFNLTFTASNDVLIGGGFDNFTAFKYDGVEIMESSPINSLSMFEILIDTDGNFKNVFSLLGADSSTVLSNNRTVILANGDMYTGGNFNGTVDFTGGNPILTDHQRGIIMKWADDITLSVPTNSFESFAVYPNPFLNNIVINTGIDQPVHIKLFDLTGKLVGTKDVSSKSPIDFSNIAKGVYLLNIQSKNQTKTVKVIKM